MNGLFPPMRTHHHDDLHATFALRTTVALCVVAVAVDVLLLTIATRPTAIGLRDGDDIATTTRAYPDALIMPHQRSAAPMLDGRRRLSPRMGDDRLAFRVVEADTHRPIAGAALFEILDKDAPPAGRRAPQRIATADEAGWIRFALPQRENLRRYFEFDEPFVILARGFDPIALDPYIHDVVQGMRRARTMNLRVVDVVGDAVSGAVVRPSWLDPRLIDHPEGLSSSALMNVQRDLADLEAELRDGATTFVTDANGRVTVPCVDTRPGRGGTIEMPGFLTTSWPPSVPALTFASERSVRLAMGRPFRGRVVDGRGLPLIGYSVTHEVGAQSAVTGKDGRFDLVLRERCTHLQLSHPAMEQRDWRGYLLPGRQLHLIAPKKPDEITTLATDESVLADDMAWQEDPTRRQVVRIVDEASATVPSKGAMSKVMRFGPVGLHGALHEQSAAEALRLAAGSYRIAVIANDAAFEDAVVDVTIAPEDTHKDITVAVHTRPHLEVEIDGATGVMVGIDSAEGRWVATTDWRHRCRLAVPQRAPYAIVVDPPMYWHWHSQPFDDSRIRVFRGPQPPPKDVLELERATVRKIRGRCIDASGSPVMVRARLELHGLDERRNEAMIVKPDTEFTLSVTMPVDVDARADLILESNDYPTHSLTVDIPAGNGRIIDLGVVTLPSESPNPITLALPDGLAADECLIEIERDGEVLPTWHVFERKWVCLRSFQRGDRFCISGRRVMRQRHECAGPGPVALPFPAGRLELSVAPLGATGRVSSAWDPISIEPIVYVDDQPFVAPLDAPWRIYGIADGRHTVLVVYRGYESMRMELEWRGGEERVIEVYLRPKP